MTRAQLRIFQSNNNPYTTSNKYNCKMARCGKVKLADIFAKNAQKLYWQPCCENPGKLSTGLVFLNINRAKSM